MASEHPDYPSEKITDKLVQIYKPAIPITSRLA